MIEIVNVMLGALGDVASVAVALLPNSPISLSTLGTTPAIMGYAAWALPFSEARTFIAALVAATAVYYVVRWVLRLARYIG